MKCQITLTHLYEEKYIVNQPRERVIKFLREIRNNTPSTIKIKCEELIKWI
jgi:hypothetical protein